MPASADKSAPSPPPPPEDFAQRVRSTLNRLGDDYVKKPLDRLLRFALGRLIAYLVAGALFVTAAVFLMVGGVEGLKAASVPPFAAYLALGAAGAAGGYALLRAIPPIEERAENPPDKGPGDSKVSKEA